MGICQARILEWVDASPEDLPNAGTEPGSPTLKVVLYCLSHQEAQSSLIQIKNPIWQIIKNVIHKEEGR